MMDWTASAVLFSRKRQLSLMIFASQQNTAWLESFNPRGVNTDYVHHLPPASFLSMPESTSNHDTQELLAGLEKLFEKYLDKDDVSKEKTPLDKFWGTYLRSMKDEDEARPKDWDGNTGSILTFVRVLAPDSLSYL